MRARPLLGAACAGLSLAYAAFLHHGVGPAPDVFSPPWWAPREFLFEVLPGTPLARAVEDPGSGVWILSLPSLLLAAGVFWGTRSALARMLGASSAAACLLFAFYGVASAPRLIWSFFDWRGSATILGVGVTIGSAAVAPWLAASWLRRGSALRVVFYLPVFVAVVALIRNTTGTDPSLPFSVSPWPAVAVFGLEVAAAALAAQFAGIALGLAGLARLREPPPRPARVGLGAAVLIVGVGFPALWVWLGGRLGLLPFRVDAGRVLGTALVCAAALAVVATASRLAPPTLRRRARTIGLAALLVGAPLLAGELWALADYTTTREARAGPLIDALARYREREGVYPEFLGALVEAGDVVELPEPKIGFSVLGRSSFAYQGFGVGYVLEFSAPRWVQCAYSPPWEEEDELDDALGSGLDGEESPDQEPSLGGDEDEGETGGWTCPSKPPELW